MPRYAPRIDTAAPTTSPRRRIPIAKRDLIAALLIALSLIAPATWIEQYYSSGFYPWLQSWLVPATGWLPFPLMGVALASMALALPAWMWIGWQRGGRAGQSAWQRLGRGSLLGARYAMFAYASFLCLWGFGYRRVPLLERWDLQGTTISKADLHAFSREVNAVIWRDCPPDKRRRPRDLRAAARAIRNAQARLIREREGFVPRFPRRVKSPPKGLLLAMDVSGVVSPWTLEAHVDAGLPDPQWLGCYAHELAHLAGYCGEADANLIGYLSGLRSRHPYARYACALSFVRHTGLTGGRLPALAARDLGRARKARLRYRNKRLAEASAKVYNRYLKSQGVRRGLGDYRRGWQWLVVAWKRGMLPDLDCR